MQTKTLVRRGFIALMLVAAGLSAGNNTAWAQEADREVAVRATPVKEYKEEPVEKPDYALLLRALKGVKETATLGYTALSSITGTASGLNVLINQKLELVALRDGKLHADVSLWLGDDNSKARKYVVVSDGSKLYTHLPEANKYSVKPIEVAKLTDESSRIGLLGALYYNRDLTGMVDQVTPENVDQVFEQLQTIGLTFSGSKIGTTPIFTLKIATPGKAAPAKKDEDAPKKAAEVQGITMRFWVDPETAQFRQLEIRGQEGETRFTLTEKIVRQTNRPVYEAPAFRFVPSAKDNKVADVPVDLFSK